MNKSQFINKLYDFASVLVTSVITVGIIFTCFFKVSTVNGQSMENTLHHGDTLLITSVTSHIKYGDVVVVSQPNDLEKVLIKRVIATGGQTVIIDTLRSKVYVDGIELNEPYIKEQMKYLPGLKQEYKVPEGKLFVMGDNRNYSADSRDVRIGFIDERYVMGKVFYKIGDSSIFNEEFFGE